MNKAVYRYLLQTYGRRTGVWLGFIAELIRTLLQRVWVTIIVAQIATSLASHDIASAKHYALLFLAIYIVGAIIGAIGEMVAISSEGAEYKKLTMSYYQKLIGKDMSFYRDNQTGY